MIVLTLFTLAIVDTMAACWCFLGRCLPVSCCFAPLMKSNTTGRIRLVKDASTVASEREQNHNHLLLIPGVCNVQFSRLFLAVPVGLALLLAAGLNSSALLP